MGWRPPLFVLQTSLRFALLTCAVLGSLHFVLFTRQAYCGAMVNAARCDRQRSAVRWATQRGAMTLAAHCISSGKMPSPSAQHFLPFTSIRQPHRHTPVSLAELHITLPRDRPSTSPTRWSSWNSHPRDMIQEICLLRKSKRGKMAAHSQTFCNFVW